MPDTLLLLLSTIQNAIDLADLRERLVPRATRYFEATRGALFVFAEFPEASEAMQRNPVARALYEQHVPLHEGTVLAPGQWQAICQRADHGHVLAGPIVQNGTLVGVLAFTRAVGLPEFEGQNLADLSALCLHVSTRLERLEVQAHASQEKGWELSGRERQIVALVAQGHTNAHIAAQLCVSSETIKQALKRIFRKTGVTSRAQLAARAATHFTASASDSESTL